MGAIAGLPCATAARVTPHYHLTYVSPEGLWAIARKNMRASYLQTIIQQAADLKLVLAINVSEGFAL
jgi:hypothetical protein